MPIGRAFGPLTVHESGSVCCGTGRAAAAGSRPADTLELDTSFSAQIGPVYMRHRPARPRVHRRHGASRPTSATCGWSTCSSAPSSRAASRCNVETAIVAGGGSILHDPDQGIYFGILDLAFRGGLTMQAICLVATKQPDGDKGFSMVAILTIELGNPWPLGMGFHLDGFGGLLALHRTFDEVAMRAALPTGQLRNVLFPADPVHHTAEILHALQTLFPAQAGQPPLRAARQDRLGLADARSSSSSACSTSGAVSTG